MDVLSLPGMQSGSIRCVEMHTTGEPTRIVISGYPQITGTLLEQRAQAKSQHDHIRKRLMLEPRGHFDMYGAILRPDTELSKTGEAHMGVLFAHNEGYSTMCGHATIALGRFLVDTHDLQVFPRRNEIRHDANAQTARVMLHAPCGLIQITVPTSPDGRASDPSRPVSFVSVPSFATGIDVTINIPSACQWPELGGRDFVKADFCYGGAFYCLVSPQALGFPETVLRGSTMLQPISNATRLLKRAISETREYRNFVTHPDENNLSFLYSIIVVDRGYGLTTARSKDAETGLCFFADQQVDRSPTGSAVAARVAHAVATGTLEQGETRTYHSLVSNASGGRGGFDGTVLHTDLKGGSHGSTSVLVEVQGQAYYTAFHTFVVEDDDPLGNGGFVLGAS